MITAAEIRGKIAAGMVMTTYNGRLGWVGDRYQWDTAARYSHWLASQGRLPNDRDGLREMEPNVWIR